MTTGLEIRVPSGSGVDVRAVTERTRTALSQFHRALRSHADVQATVIEDPAMDAVEFIADSGPLGYPPEIARRATAWARAGSVPVGTAADCWTAAAVSPQSAEEFIVALVSHLGPEAPAQIVGQDAWLRWRRSCSKSVTILLDSDWLPTLTQTIDRQHFPAVRSSIAANLGLPLPPMQLIADPTLHSRGFTIVLNGVPIASQRAFGDDLVLATETADPADPDAKPWGAPARLNAWSLQPVSRLASLEDRGVVCWSASEYVILALYSVVTRHADWLIDSSVVSALLEQLRVNSPRAVDLVMREPTDRLEDVLADLLAEEISIHPLGSIIESLLRATDTTSLAAIRAARDRLAPQISELAAVNGTVPVWLLLPPGDPEDPYWVTAVCADLRHRVDTWSGSLPLPALLVGEPLRPSLARAARISVPEIRVLSFDDLPANQPVQPMDRLSIKPIIGGRSGQRLREEEAKRRLPRAGSEVTDDHAPPVQ